MIQKSELAKELEVLFDLKKAKSRDRTIFSKEAVEAHKDIKLVILMFRDGVPDLSLEFGENEKMKWDSKNQRLLYVHNQVVMLLEAAPVDVRLRVRPYLADLVKKAKEFFSDDPSPSNN